MPGELSSVLRDIVSKAANAPTGNTGEVARIKKRFEGCTDALVVLADCSGSMNDSIGSSGLRKIEHLKIALSDLLTAHPAAIIIAFGSSAKRLRGPEDLSENLLGSTNLCAGIDLAMKLKPRRTVIISDGLPDDEKGAAQMVDDLTGQVDCVYCGPDGHPAIRYLHSLARAGGGRAMTFDGCRELSPMIRGLLA